METDTRTERRRLWALWPIAAGLTWLGAMVWVGGQIGIGGIGIGVGLSMILAIPIVAVFLWFDRWEHERPRLLTSAFAWGATIAAFCAIWSQQWLQALVDTAMGADVGAWVRPLAITPVTEEVLKGLFVVWLLVRRRREITGVLDGIVYAGLAGAGFAFTENVLYLGRAVTDFAAAATSDTSAIPALGVSLFLRVVMVPFFHPLMVALTGIGVGLAARARGRVGRVLPVVIGLLVAIILHGVWDWAGLASSDPYLIFKIYGAVLVPVFLAALVLVLVLRHREGRMIAMAVPRLVRDGDIASDEAELLTSLRARRRWRADVRRRAGRSAARATGRYQAEASALAIRVARDRSGDRGELDEQRRIVAVARSLSASARPPR